MHPFILEGRMDLDISFKEHTMKTPVYIKMDATTPLLLSEGVCHQLHILSYHPSIGVLGSDAGNSVPSDSSDEVRERYQKMISETRKSRIRMD